jgi:hypothetical protein
VWIKEEEQINNLRIESTLRPIALYFDEAPGVQGKKKNHKDLTERALMLQMRDMQFRTAFGPCMLKVLVALGYTQDHLDALSLKDFQRLEAMILAVRKELHIEAPPLVRPNSFSEVVHAHGTGDK